MAEISEPGYIITLYTAYYKLKYRAIPSITFNVRGPPCSRHLA